MQRINAHLHSKNSRPYVINLDPAVHTVPFTPNIDIRDSVNYKEVMKQYNLGPNGGILTSLNLFTTKVDQILGLLEKRTKPDPENPASRPVKQIIVDTPGQIEVFVWSASGAILLDSLATSFPTVIAYVIDTPRTASTSTFMSNMLYACSILYKTKLPMILVFNKSDIKDPAFAKEWMTDFEAFQAALRGEEEGGSFGGFEGGDGGAGGSGYMGSLLNSMSLLLEEFYSHLSVVGVSAMTGDGVDDFFEAVQGKVKEFEQDYRPELERRQKEREQAKEDRRQAELGKLMKDMNVKGGSKTASAKASGSKPAKKEPTVISDIESDEDEEMAEDDDDSEEEEDDGLQERYKQALADQGGAVPKANQDDASFARYLRSNKID